MTVPLLAARKLDLNDKGFFQAMQQKKLELLLYNTSFKDVE